LNERYNRAGSWGGYYCSGNFYLVKHLLREKHIIKSYILVTVTRAVGEFTGIKILKGGR
jgi:hypothetical protein